MPFKPPPGHILPADAAERKGTRRQTINLALDRGELNGCRDEIGRRAVLPDATFDAWAPAAAGRPRVANPVKKRRPSPADSVAADDA